MDDRQPVSLARRALSYLICYLVAVQPMLPAAAAQIIPVTPGTQMDAAGNGVPVVNIAAPNGAGVSHNQYQQYNVGQEGLILNNATGQLNQTQLGGLIQNNPNLKAGQEARAIINEVTGANRSQLQGYTEVAGKAASVMVANPYGITCNGCGFINTPNVTLTTGRPQLDANGNLAALEVSKGAVIVEGKGLDGSSADAVSIVARATEINAGIHAKDLSVTLGANRVGADGSVTPIAGEGAAPSVAVDTGALGGMYANRIRLVSSEKGVGVNLGNLMAKQGDIQLDSSGQLTLNTSLSSGALTAKGASVALGGDNKAAGQIAVNAQQDVAIGPGALVSDADITVSASGNLTTQGANLTAGRDIRLSGGTLSADQASRGNAGETIQLQAAKQLSHAGQFTAGKTLSATAQQLDNRGSLAAAATTLSTGTLTNHSGATLAGSGSLAVRSDYLLNQGVLSAPVLALDSVQTDNSGLLQGADALSFSGGQLNNLAGGTLSSNNGFSLFFQNLDNGGLISSGATLTLGGRSLTNSGEINAANLTARNETIVNGGGSLLAEHRLQLNNDILDNSGKIAAEQLAINSGKVSNSGTLQAKQTLETQGQQLDNRGTLLSDGQLTLKADALSNAGALQGQQLTITASSGLNSGKVLSLGDASLTLDHLNNSGTLLSQQALRLSSGETDNNGLIQGTRALSLTGQRLTNLKQGTVSSENSFGLNLPELNNLGLITSGGTLTLAGASLTNGGEINAADIVANNDSFSNQQGARLLADNALQLNNARLTNGGEIAASQLNIDGATLINSGTLQGKQALLAADQRLTNSGTLLSGGELKLNAGQLENSGLMQGQQLNLTAADWQNRGNALSVGDEQLKADSLNNSGKILGQQGVQLQAGKTDNSGWLLAQVLTLQSDLVNSGLMQGADALTLQGNQLSNQTSGQLLSGGTLAVQGDNLTNQGSLQGDRIDLRVNSWQNPGSARAASQLSAEVSGLLDNGGTLLSEKRVDLTSGETRNAGTLAADQLHVTTANLYNAGLLQGNSALTLSGATIANAVGGQLISGSSLSLSPATLTNAGLLQISGDFNLNGRDFSNSGRVTADNVTTRLTGTLSNGDAGVLLARQQATLQAATLDNAGTLAAQQLTATGDRLANRGLMQGDAALSTAFGQLNNLSAGTLLSGGDLGLQATSGSNAGAMQGSDLHYQFGELTNSGTVNGIATLTGTTAGLLDNSGTMVTKGSASLTAGRLDNRGRLMADSLLLHGDTLSNSGLWQGSTLLDAQATNAVTQTSSGKALSGGDLLLSARDLNSDGTLQGNRVQIDAESWQHQGSLLSSGNLTASISGALRNGGAVMSQGTSLITAQDAENSGSLLSEKAMTLRGGVLNNGGTVQGETLTVTPASVTNQGSLIGLQSLTLGPAAAVRALRLLAVQAQPARVLINNPGGQLLTQGTLSITGDTVTNNGTWQGQQILLNAASLANGGAIQSADAMQLNLRDRLSSSAGSKITANGTAALSALSLSNQGQWIAKNLTLNGTTLDNGGEISGVNGLTTLLGNTLTQQQNGSLLSGGRLELQAAAVNNAGRVQGADLAMTTGAVANSGRLQGDSNLLLTASGRVTNEGSGTLLSQSGLTLTTPELYNYGLIQGANSRLTANSSATNSGRVLSAGELTLNAPQLTNSGWLQAMQLTLNAANASNSGTLLADGQGTLTGAQLQNQGTAQGGSLTVNYAQLTNNGTLLGVSQLNVKASQVTQQASGRLFSGGNLLLESGGFDQLGQVVALGDAALNLINGFTVRNTLAAGNRLSISSNGAIDNQSTLQGQALTLSAGGDLTNNGQITTGSGDSSLSGNRIAMNGSGTLQGGGNVSLNSRSDITINGFTGTLGSLTLSSPGSIVNAALLYAGQNLALYANSIRNQRGDMLAGNSLWMQGDAAGNANGEVINTSGTIESQNGDINIKTGHLLNTRDGLQVQESTKQINTVSGVGNASIDLPYTQMEDGTWGYYSKTGIHQTGPCNGHGACNYNKVTNYYYAPFADYATQKFATSETSVSVVSKGSAGRISAGNNLIIYANSLDNQASNILANQNISLFGSQLNNQSWQAGKKVENLVYKYALKNSKNAPPLATIASSTKVPTKPKVNTIYFELVGHESTFTPGELYRSVIQAGGNVSASFSGDISNTSTTANAGWNGNTLTAPAVAGLAALNQTGTTQRQTLAASSQVAVNSPAWRDQLQNALQQVNGGVALDGTKPGEASLTQLSAAHQGLAALGQAGNLVKGNLTPTSLLHNISTKVDTSAYPLPVSNNGYFVAGNNDSPYLITINPKLNGLGQLDSNLFGDLNTLLGKHPGSAPTEIRQQYTDVNTFLGSSYLLNRLDLKPDSDYRFLGDAAFDTRYVSNTVLNQTGSRYLHGIGSDLEQMRYLMDNAAAAQQSLGLQFGVSLSADQVAALDKSIIWWEATTINGQTVMVPKVYLSSKDAEMNNGSVIAGNNVTLSSGNIVNDSSTLTAKNGMAVDSQNRIDNLSAGLISASGDLKLSALGDINNVSSAIKGKKVELESLNGSINSITTSQQWSLDAGTKSFSETLNGQTASITSIDDLSLSAGNNIGLTAANLSAGGNLLLNAWNDIAIKGNQQIEGQSQSGKKAGWYKTEKSSTQTVSNVGSQIAAGGDLALNAGHNLSIIASSLAGKGDTALAAGNDVNLNSAATSQNSSKGNKESHTSDVDRTAITSGGDLSISAGRNLTSQAAAIVADGDVGLQAGRDINLNAEESRTGNSERGSKKTVINETVRQQGTEIVSGGSATLVAGNDITSQASILTANNDLALQAGHDVNITTATESDYAYKEETKTKKGLFSKKTTHTISEESATAEKASQLSGDRVSIIAGNDLTVKGSSVIGAGDVGLKAGNDLTIAAATDTQTSYRLSETKKSGMFSGGGIGVTFGSASSKQQLKQDGTTQSQSASTIGSTGGNVTLVAGQDARVAGSDVIAKQNISLVGGSVTIDPGNDTLTRRQSYEQKQSGLTLQLTSPITDALLSLGSQAKEASQAGDDRLKALNAVKMLESGWAMSGAAKDSALALANGKIDDVGIKIELNVGSSKSKSSSEYSSNTVSGSSLSGGGSVAVVATGANGASGDLTLAGSGITGKDVTLAAAHDLNLVAASNHTEQKSSNKSSGWSAGVHAAIGKQTGFGVQANGYMASGGENGDSTTNVNSRVNAKDNLTLSSGNDMLLSGAQALGDSISANAGNNLTLTSLQDTDNYQSKQQSACGGFSFTWGTGGSAGLSLSKSKINSEYASVGDQSGLFAGDGGYDIFVGNHTQLNGAVIASTADAANNRLSTGTLGWDSIDNHVSYSASSASFGISGGYKSENAPGQQFAGGALPPTFVNMSGSASGTTRSAVADGAITVRDAQHQAQDVTGLSRDTENANGRIDKIFDKDKVNNQMAFAQGVQQLAGNIYGDVKASKLDAAAKETSERLLKEHPDYARLSQAQFNEHVQSDPGYKAVAAQWGTGGTYSMVATAVAGALGGLSASNLGAAAGGAMAPYLANAIKKATTTYDGQGNPHTDVLANTMAHAVAGAVLAQIAGGSAAAGAAGAAGGELAAKAIVKVMYPDTDIRDLTESQKQTVSALSQMAAGLAGGIASDSALGGGTGAGAGKNAVENNFLSQGRPKDFTEQLKGCNGNPSCEQGVRKDMAKESAENILKLKSCWEAGDTACVAQMRTQIELNEKAYTALRVQDDLVGRAYEDSAKWYADIIDNCNGQCDWLSASLQKTFADGMTNAVYGALAVSTGSLSKPGQTVKPVSETTGRGIVPEQGSVANANFAQSKIRANETFSAEGVAKYSQMAGQPVNTVDDLANAIRSGLIKPSQLSVDYVEMNGTRLILNTRTSVALDRAGIPKSDWYGTNQTNVKVPGMDGKTYNDLAADQLIRNKLPETGSSDIPRGRK
ncbi:hemagglutinin repeat-containing protein [Pantoea agglomerans]|uniref:hemagglutinin repeat-containing protein n=1 Tax=Enterobacter agglomerans TaxID=549 RepID=UPI001CCC04F1|nr:hemagglutinin repeat-containing protein [Pantoea agglomerans]UBN56131.1 hemagglutinin repeat-containing protein [Pantoea agglomerans]